MVWQLIRILIEVIILGASYNIVKSGLKGKYIDFVGNYIAKVKYLQFGRPLNTLELQLNPTDFVNILLEMNSKT